MKFNNLVYYLFIGILIYLSGCSVFEGNQQKKDTSEKTAKDTVQVDKGPYEPYNKVITPEAETDTGLFMVHRIEDDYFFEIPDSLLNRVMLMVSTIAKAPQGVAYGGQNIHNQVIRWVKMEKKILLRVDSYNNVANDSLPIYRSVESSNFEPIIMAFPIKAISKDSAAYVIEVTDLFSTDVPALNIGDPVKKKFKISALDPKRSFITSINSYPINIEARHIMTYKAANPPANTTTGVITMEINNSMVLLPKEPMKARLYDQRVGYFTTSQVDFGINNQKATEMTYIRRWRLEPKDMEAFKRGELVEPVDPIVFYIDPATPHKWRKYIKAGVEDWLEAFEAAGFRNAIMAKDPPSEEEFPGWSPEDARFSVIRYFASTNQNAYGPNVHDPRSGEIIESDIGWFHNVMVLLRNWYFVQTAAANPKARTMDLDDEVMGRLIRYVAAHEVGHTLGLPHNMGASHAFPVDSLRSASFTQKYGTTPSIMDYARFNYIAQPEDEDIYWYPKIGRYDVYSIRWGYRPIMEESPKDEQPVLNKWIREHEGDSIYFYGQQMFSPLDPRSQSEDLGNNPLKASVYGIDNLKRIIDKLIQWTYQEGENYEDLEEMYQQVVGQWFRYMGHVETVIGGININYKTYNQEGIVYDPVPRGAQKDAVAFLHEYAFETPEWLIDEEILYRIEAAGILERVRRLQTRILHDLLSISRLARLIEVHAMNDDNYSVVEFMEDIRLGIFSEVYAGEQITPYRRNLQKGYVEHMEHLLSEDQPDVPEQLKDFMGITVVEIDQSDIRSVVRAELKNLRRDLQRNMAGYYGIEKYHLQDLIDRIPQILKPDED